MSNNFKVKVNNATEFDISTKAVLDLDVQHISETDYHILQNHQQFEALLVHSNFNKKQYQIKINGNIYVVDISNDLDVLIDKMGFAVGATKQVNSIKAPMPGLILDIQVNEGQEVKEDEALLILEAMKMENVITSPRDGVIKSISATKGGTVEKGNLLVDFE